MEKPALGTFSISESVCEVVVGVVAVVDWGMVDVGMFAGFVVVAMSIGGLGGDRGDVGEDVLSGEAVGGWIGVVER